MTIRGFCRLNKIKKHAAELRQFGKQAVALSKDHGYETGKIHDEMYGEVNSYRIEVLEEIFEIEPE